jgi:hypothetical protein
MPLTQIRTSNLDTTNSLFFRNRIINGDMRIDQRNAGASVTLSSGSIYTIDRWNFELSQASKISVQQNAGSVTPPPGFTNYLGITSLSAYSVLSGDYFSFRQLIEGYNVADLGWGTANAKTITVSFWVRSSLTGTFGGAIKNGDSNYNYPFSYTINSANTWEQKSIIIAGPTSGTWNNTTSAGLQLYIGLGTGSQYGNGTAGAWTTSNFVTVTGATSVVGTNGATFYITGVQLEVGTAATAFERRPYGTELQLCQRYCEVLSFENDQYTGASGFAQTSGTSYFAQSWTQVKRASPTVTFTGTNWNAQGLADSSSPTAISATRISLTAANILLSASFSGTNGQAVNLRSLANSQKITISAEL